MTTAHSTIDLLFNAIITSTPIDDIHPAVFDDYFGFDTNKDNYCMIYGIYEGLIKHKGVSKILLENSFITNRLDELIHNKFTHHKSRCYEEFCEKNIKIGNTYYNFVEDTSIDKLIILTDDCCASCDTVGYYTKQNHTLMHPAPPDCFKCCNHICKMCSNFDNKEGAFICHKCENPNIIASINTKIRGYHKTDFETFGIIGNINKEDVVALLNKQKFKCYVCDDIVLTFGWKPHCLYQFSVDRINNLLPHNKDNVLISCYYCNCVNYFANLNCSENKKHKVCDNGCHCEKRNITATRETIPIDKINSLKL